MSDHDSHEHADDPFAAPTAPASEGPPPPVGDAHAAAPAPAPAGGARRVPTAALVAVGALALLAVGGIGIALALGGGDEPAPTAAETSPPPAPEATPTPEPSATGTTPPEPSPSPAAVDGGYLAGASQSGRVTFAYGEDWLDILDEASRASMEASMGAGLPVDGEVEVVGMWITDGDLFTGGSSALVVTMHGYTSPSVRAEASSFAASNGALTDSWDVTAEEELTSPAGYAGYQVRYETRIEGISIDNCVVALRAPTGLSFVYASSDADGAACAAIARPLAESIEMS